MISTTNSDIIEEPKIELRVEPHSCNMYGIDLTIGCEHGCLYCFFSKIKEEEWKKKGYNNFPIPVDISPIFDLKELPKGVIYLSPNSDPFAPAARELAHELLSFLLPKGLIVTITTKNIIPTETLNLLKNYHSQIRIGIGITNLDAIRNAIVEPYCPPAKERLTFLSKLTKTEWNDIEVRMDPLIPEIDDSDEVMGKTVDAIAMAGIKTITTNYITTFGKFLMRLKKEDFLRGSIRHITEKVYMEGGLAFSVPIKVAKNTYNKLNSLCKSKGMKLLLCGCREKRFSESGYPLLCRNNY